MPFTFLNTSYFLMNVFESTSPTNLVFHSVAAAFLTLSAHEKRGAEAMDDIGILPHFTGVMCHDHWKPYYRYECQYSLCNAHHLRELLRAYEQDNQMWTEEMRVYLIALNQ